jgi:hypothetical protein
MFGMKLFAALVFLCMAMPATGAAQQPTEPVPPPWQIAPPVRSLPVHEIYVDRKCTVTFYPEGEAPGIKPEKAYFPKEPLIKSSLGIAIG